MTEAIFRLKKHHWLGTLVCSVYHQLPIFETVPVDVILLKSYCLCDVITDTWTDAHLSMNMGVIIYPLYACRGRATVADILSHVVWQLMNRRNYSNDNSAMVAVAFK